MSAINLKDPTVLSANEEFKAKYPIYMRWSALAAVLLTLIGVMLSPNYVPNPYTLRQEEIEVVDLDDQEIIDVPPPPKEAPPPPKVIEAAPDDEVSDDVDIADTLMDIDDAISSTMVEYDLGGDEGFVASSEKPKFKTRVKADYPEMARRAQIEGTVLVKVLVGPDGRVKQAQVLQSVNPLLDKAAIEAAWKWTFHPGKQRNIPVKAWMAIPFNFRLH
jgi:periplasmic protein TonB